MALPLTSMSWPQRVEAVHQAAAVAELLQRDAVEPHVGHALALWFERPVGGAEEAGLARIGPRAMRRRRGQTDERRHRRIGRALHLGEHRADARPAAHRTQRIVRPTGHALDRVMAVGTAGDRADDDALVHVLGHAREDFADLQAVDVGLDRAELAADFGRRFHLEVPHILVRRSAAEKDVDDRFMRGWRARRPGCRGGFGTIEIGERKRRGAECEGADFHEAAAVDAVAIARGGTENLQHETALSAQEAGQAGRRGSQADADTPHTSALNGTRALPMPIVVSSVRLHLHEG